MEKLSPPASRPACRLSRFCPDRLILCAVRALVVLFVVGVVALGVARASLGGQLGSGSGSISAQSVQKCLFEHHVMATVLTVTSKQRKYLPPGVVESVAIIGSVPGVAPAPGEITIDDGTLWFFRTAALARKGEAKLVATWIYGRGLTPFEAALMAAHRPPNAAAARPLHQVLLNAVVIWQYPRHYVAPSNKVVERCIHP